MDSKPSSSRILPRLLPIALFSLLLGAIYADPLFMRRNFVGRDLVVYGLPLEKMVHDGWARGRLPVWSEDLSGGRPLLPNPNAGAFYPLRPLLSRLPFDRAMRIFPILHWWIAGAGMIALMRALGSSGAASFLAAVTYVFSGAIVTEVFYTPFQAATTLIPWALWAVARKAARPGGRVLAIAAVFGLLLLLGDIFEVVIALLACGIFLVCDVDRASRRRELGALVLGLALAGLLAAPQVVATALLAPETRRAVTGIPLREVLGFTLSPWRLAELVVPQPFGNFWTLDDQMAWGSAVFRGFFVSAYAGAFAFIALLVLRKARVPGARSAVTLFLAGAVLAIAGRFVPMAWMERVSLIPLRYPEKFVVAMDLALAILAGLALDHFRRTDRAPAWIFGVGLGLAAAAGAASLFPQRAAALAAAAIGAPADGAGRAARQLPGALAEAGLFWMVTVVALDLLRRPGHARTAAGVVLLAAVPIAANRRIAHTESAASVFAPTRFARTVARRDPAGDFRVLDESVYRPASPLALAPFADPFMTENFRQNWSLATQALWNRATVLNLDPDRGDLSRLESLRRVSGLAAKSAGGAPLFSALGLRYGIRYADQEPLPGFREFHREASRSWDENPGARPALRLLESWREEPGAVAALQALPGLAESEVVLETGRRGRGSAAPGEVRLIETSPERLVLETQSAEPTWLFVVRGYWRYRSIRIDGRPAEAVPAQLAFSAVPVPPGSHRIEWREEVPGLAMSRWGPVLFVLLAAGLLARRSPEPGASP